MENSESKVCFKVRRSPMGLIYIYLLTIIAFGGSLALVIWASGELFNFDSSASKAWGVLTATGITIIVSMLLLFETVVYWSNRLVLMDDEIRQTLQKGLLNRKISSLGLANIEDVTIEQKGFMATLFNYGTLLIETAGEQSNFQFNYCPDPTKYSRQIMEARERYLMREDKPTRRADIVR
ncbi:PH domain-containing protein [Candidatus Saccharibacteria bacterium]|nr:PH domain-containing protein [Candidatus Saccharibacteria bacterium]MCB9820978.1 PH domain-containing protein [Candidatus Nomurabacteria bacterium]